LTDDAREGRTSTDWSRWGEIDAVFERLLDHPPEAWEALLAEATPDEGIRAAVRRLLASTREADDPASVIPAGAAADALRELAPETVPERVGPFRPVRELGTGGMGRVFLAERVEGDFEQQVALKLLRPGLDTGELLARFRSERRILASLRHPNIAPLVDGGATPDGRPWLAMEFVDGEPLVEHCERRHLSVRDRVLLIRSVALAVRAAHRSLVVHRDIKPSNVLVTREGVPKLLDFGIAKLIDPTATDDTDRTRIGVRLLTPRYAAPEQRESGPITTATDVFQLGLLLIETVTGARVDGERPADTLRHARGLRGDLERIAAMATRLDPERRYRDAGAFVEDLDRWLEGRPVVARPDSVLYRSRKLLQRNPWLGPVAAAGLVLGVGWAWTVVHQSAALEVQRDLARAEADRAVAERERAEQVSAFLVSLFEASDPRGGGRGDTVSARTLLVDGATRVRTELAGQPETLATLLATLGEIARVLGMPLGYELLDDALRYQAEVSGSDSDALAAAFKGQAGFYAGQRDFSRAEERAREAVRITRALADPEADSLASRLFVWSTALLEIGDLEGATAALQEAVDLREAAGWTDEKGNAGALTQLAMLRRRVGADDEAEVLYRRALDLQRAQPDLPRRELAITLNNLAFLLRTQERFDEAEPLYREALALTLEAFDPVDRQVQVVFGNLASVLHLQGKSAEAEEVLRTDLERHREVFPDDHWRLALATGALASLLGRLERHADAEALRREEVAIYRDALGGTHSWTVRALLERGRVLLALGDRAAARAVLLEADSAARLIDDVPDPEPLRALVSEALAQAESAR
jgi:eukaryotic-like serine/threonine-protein kinase